MNKKVVIVGGGASGIICAIRLRQLSEDLDITILERQNRIGKKILVTGNGKCNITNKNVSKENYNHQDFMSKVLSSFGFNECEEFFKDLGILFQVDDIGRAYPYGESAKALLDLLMLILERSRINIKTSEEVIDVKRNNLGYSISTLTNRYSADVVVFASGGQAAINFTNKTYEILESLNHSVKRLDPGLVPLKVYEDTKSLSGVRHKTRVSLMRNSECLYSVRGEIQFRDDGLSGILSLEISSQYMRLENKDNAFLSLDLMSDYDEETVFKLLNDKLQKGFNDEELLTGLFNKMLSLEILRRARQNGGNLVANLVRQIKDFRFNVIGTYPFINAQVTIGGVSVEEVDENFESRVNENLYIVGEVLDIDGDTGGFNLHFAWLSGILAANNIVAKI